MSQEFGEFFRLKPQGVHRDGRFERRLVGRDSGGQWGSDEAGGNAVDPDATGGVGGRGRQSQADHPGLGGGDCFVVHEAHASRS